MEKMANESQISSFYARKKILVTGGTGSMGKVLIWKLLQSCVELDTIYVLMRPKRGKDPMSRKEELFGSLIFKNFKTNNPKILDKVIFVSGDVGEEEIGLSDKDRSILIDEVSIVFHSAAVLKMDADLRTAINVNTVGTARMLDIAQNMKKLETFVHVSTAFCCCEELMVEERIYPSKHNPQDIINLTRWMEPEILKQITPKLISPLPNTYVYSKRLTESLLLNYESKVPIIVARPSIGLGQTLCQNEAILQSIQFVISKKVKVAQLNSFGTLFEKESNSESITASIMIPAIEEPLPGWNDSLNGPAGLFTAGGAGIMRTSMMNIDVKSDVIPVDIAINSIIALPWANSKEQLLKEISVYNITQTAHDDMIWRDIIDLFRDAFKKYPFEHIFWYPSTDQFTSNIVIYTIKCIFLHYLPAYIIDFILLLVGQKTFLVRLHDKLRQGEKVLRFFTQQQWTFLHDKLLQMERLLNDADKCLFPVNMIVVDDTKKYIKNATIGVKVFIFKEDMKNVDNAKRIANIMYVLDKIILALRYFVLWKILLFLFNIILLIQVN